MNNHEKSICLILTQPFFFASTFDELLIKIITPYLLSLANVLLKPKLKIRVKYSKQQIHHQEKPQN